jgi:hypothetical protein
VSNRPGSQRKNKSRPRQSNDNVRQARRSKAYLGQKEAEVEKTSEEQLRHMEGGDAVESSPQQKAKSQSK